MNGLLRWLVILVWSSGCASLWAAATGPNVILVMTDDQGYGDLACHGNEVIKTPNLDRLYAESVRLEDFHVDPAWNRGQGNRGQVRNFKIQCFSSPANLSSAFCFR